MPIPFIDATRQNHALEHATITILLQKLPKPVRLVGRSTPFGFYIHGDVPTDPLIESLHEALRRLQAGEARLAVSPLCGTNIAVAGVLAGIGSLLAFGDGRSPDRWFRALLAATGALVVAPPLGHLAQKYLTTSPNLASASVKRVSRTGRGVFTVHRVEIQRAS